MTPPLAQRDLCPHVRNLPTLHHTTLHTGGALVTSCKSADCGDNWDNFRVGHANRTRAQKKTPLGASSVAAAGRQRKSLGLSSEKTSSDATDRPAALVVHVWRGACGRVDRVALPRRRTGVAFPPPTGGTRTALTKSSLLRWRAVTSGQVRLLETSARSAFMAFPAREAGSLNAFDPLFLRVIPSRLLHNDLRALRFQARSATMTPDTSRNEELRWAS
jgi:hypothetical protein